LASLSAREETVEPSLKMSLPMISWCFAWDVCAFRRVWVMMMSTRDFEEADVFV